MTTIVAIVIAVVAFGGMIFVFRNFRKQSDLGAQDGIVPEDYD